MVWTKLTTTLNVCGALLAVPAGAAGLYTTYQATFSTEASCRALRASILSTLEKNVDAKVKQALVHKDAAAFEHSCAQSDPEAKTVVAAVGSNDQFAKGGDQADSRPVRFLRPAPFFLRHWSHQRGTTLAPRPADPREPFGT